MDCNSCPLMNYQIGGKIWSVKEVLSIYCKPTHYERNHGILCGSWKIIKDCGDVKFFGNVKSDGTKTLLLLHRQGLSQNWVGWMVSENQAETMITVFPKIYNSINEKNEKKNLADYM